MKTDRAKLARVLFDQIVRHDCYGIRRLIDDPPEVVLDIGANCGVFSMFCRMLFPYARIISVEPCPSTFDMLIDNLKFYHCELRNVALSHEDFVYIHPGRDSGSNSTVDVLDADGEGKIPGMDLAEMFRRWSIYPSKQTVLAKVDCEGAERVIIEHNQSHACIMQCRHLAMELHFCDGRGADKWFNAPPKRQVMKWIDRLKKEWCGHIDYEHHAMGSVQGGVLIASSSVDELQRRRTQAASLQEPV